MFEKLIEESKAAPSFNNAPSSFRFKTIEYKIDTIVSNIDNVDSLSDDDVKDIIIRQHAMILNYDLFLSNQDTRTSALKLFTNIRFLKIFLNTIGLIQLTNEEVICINKLTYDYYILDNKDTEIQDLLLSISYLINNQLVIKLSAYLGLNASRVLSMIANSSFKTEKQIHRINTFLVKYDGADISVQGYVDIYLTIYTHFNDLFVYSMLECWNMPINTPVLERQYKRYTRMSQALLCILDSMPSRDIMTIIRNYGYTLLMVAPNTPIRFSIKNLKGYDRIKEIVESAEIQDTDIKIP